MRFRKGVFGKVRKNASDGVPVRYKRFTNRINLAGQNIMALSGATRANARRLIPFLVDPEKMQEKLAPESEVTATMISEIADEIHEFTRATQSTTKICRMLLKDGIVIELMLE